MPFMHRTRRTFLLQGSLATTAAFLSKRMDAAADVLQSSAAAPLRKALQASVEASGCPGVSFMMQHRGQRLFEAAQGSANLETSTAISSDSVFRIGSLTKQFTAAAILCLVDQEKLSLNDPASRFLPYFSALPMFSIAELLHQTAGLHSDEGGSITVSGALPSQIAIAQDIAKQKQVFDFPSGTTWLYSNANYVVLGAVLEAVTGKSLSVAVEQLLLGPLKLAHTAFDSATDVVPHRVSGYTPSGNDSSPYVNAQWIPIEEAGGAGAMRSTAEDLCQWHRKLFRGEVLPQPLLNKMIEPGRLRSGALSGSQRFSAQDDAMGDVQYAMGLLIAPPGPKGRTVLHYGYINGFSACLESYIDLDFTIAILCNADNNPALPFRAARKIVRETIVPTIS